jgi:predicted DsbA family dithiol-disulfide isomerase
MDITILVSCCSDYGLSATINDVVKELGIVASIGKSKDVETLMKYGVMRAPAVVINGKVKVKGRVPTRGELKGMIEEEISS